MKNKAKFFAAPITVALAVILVLSAVNAYTAPTIRKNDERKKNAVLYDVMPNADVLEEIDAVFELPATVTKIYKDSGGAGYVFALSADGYKGKIAIVCGIDSSGHMTDADVTEHHETKNLGAKVAETEYTSQYRGKGSDLSGVAAISGATISSDAFRHAIEDAFEVFAKLDGAKATSHFIDGRMTK